MRSGEEISLQSLGKISKTDPFIDENKALRVGGRTEWSNLNTEDIHLILHSSDSIATSFFVKWYHQSIGHGGRSSFLNKIRSSRS